MWAPQQMLLWYWPAVEQTLYSYTSTNNTTGLNWNAANDRYAWSFTPTVTWTPSKVILRMFSITWTPTGEIYIKADKTLASATYWTATWITFTTGTNTITLTGGSTITSWVTYWVYFIRTSNASNYFRIYNEYTSPPTQQFWRPNASNIDPNVRYDSASKNIGMSMDIKWY